MEVAIQIIWWIGLLGALIPTLIILKEVSLVLGVLQDIYKLTERTRVASEGLLDNVRIIQEVETLEGQVTPVQEAMAQVAASAAAIESSLAKFSVKGRRG